jgi:mono/diheme cytochrome c family protein
MFPAVLTALAFVVGFILIGLAVVAAAFSGSRRREGRAPGPTRSGRRAVGAAVAAVVVLIGILVPALVLAAGRNADKGPGGVELNAAETRGRQVFHERCSTCHTLAAANATAKVGPNLDALRPPKELTLDAIAKGRAQGRGQMPAGLVDGEDAQDVAAFIAKVAGR